MKKRLLALLLCMAMVFSMTACGSSEGESVDGTESVENTESTEATMPVVDLAKYEFNYADYVTLGDYSAIPVELAQSYEVTDEDVENYIIEWFEYSGPFYVADETKTVIEEGDIVDVNYVGKLDGVAFDGGSAQNQIIDVSGNCTAGGSTSYIDGFTAGLLGAEVGTDVDCNVTFPENYGSADLAGKEVVFTFTVNSIQKPMAFEEIDDTFAQNYAGTQTVDEMYVMVREGLEAENEYSKMEDGNACIQQYLLDNCTVDIPADYFADLMEAYRNMFIWTYCEGDESQLEEFLSTNYGYTVEQVEETWREALTINVKLDFILGAIAQELGMELDTASYETELANFVSAYSLENAEPMFESYGYGDVVYGEKRMKEMHLQSDVLEKLTETAVITIAEPVEETETVAE
ncbi:MAG: FKBP-type peptidyl-prolyl cis-trans isomerase [Roseburia sp.]|nr:FKBP-type peptidyl-prolyl cis-trans isomerase [Roseburia sp.]